MARKQSSQKAKQPKNPAARASAPTLEPIRRAKQLTSREELLSLPVVVQGCKRWEDMLPPDVRQDLDDVKAGLKSGEIKHSKAAAFAYLKKKHGLTIQASSFLNYLDR